MKQEEKLLQLHPVVAEALMQQYDDETLSQLMQDAPIELAYIAGRVLRHRHAVRRGKPASHRLNYPIDEVLDDYVNRRKGKLVEAKRQLRKRFDGLDHDKQEAVMKAFMEQGREAERDFICEKLMGEDFWTDAYIPLVERWWERYGDRELARVVVKRCPGEYVLRHREELLGKCNYASLCLKTGMAPDPEKMLPRTYLYVLKTIGGQLRFREGEETVLRCVRAYLYEEGLDKPVDSIYDIPYVRRMMVYLGEMGLTDDIMALDAFDKRLCNVPLPQWGLAAIRAIEEEFNFPEYIFRNVR